MSAWYLYLIRAHNNTLYTGISTDVERRFLEHQSGGAKAARSLKGKGPLTLMYVTKIGSHSQALSVEYRIKKLPRTKKLALINGELDINQLYQLS